jgi:folate-binding protein YgfZ
MSETPSPGEAGGSGGSAAELRAVRRLHLRSWHLRRGAVLGVRRGSELPLHYGDADRELEALHTGCALVDQSDAGRLELLGADRQRFLNGLLTVDVAALGEGQGAHGFATDGRGRILADVTLLAHADRLWLEAPAGREGTLAEHLLRYRVADRVEVLPMEDLLPLTLVGAGLEAALAGAGFEPPARAQRGLAHGRATWFGSEVHVAWSDRLGAPALEVWMSSSIAGLVADELLERLGATPVGDDACEVLRLEAKVPRFGVDFDDTNLPGEVGTAGAVDWKKGCYLGQEIVARMHYRGQPARVLRRLRLEGESLPAPGAAVILEERPAGAVTSVARSPREGVLALAMVQRRAGDAGTTVLVEGAGPAQVEAVAGSE